MFVMYKFAYLFLFLFVVSTSISQPVITDKIIPVVGDSYSFTNCDTNGISQGNAGAGVTWNFSNLVLKTGQDATFSYDIVSPGQGLKSELFPTATYAYKTEDAYGYYKTGSSFVERLGTGFADGSEVLTNTEIFMNYPFTYGDNSTDDFEGNLTMTIEGEVYTLNRKGTVNSTADAYGTLILPQGTFSNVLRIKSIHNTRDTMPPPVPGFPGIIMTTEIETYTWTNDSYKFGLLTISVVTNSQSMMGQNTTTVVKNVHIHNAEAQTETLTTPQITSPVNGTSNLDIPFTVQWTASEIIVSGAVEDVILEEINYNVQVTTLSDFSNPQKMVEYNVTGVTSVEVSDPKMTGAVYCRVKSSYGSINSEWSPVSSYTVNADAPEVPVQLSPANGAIDVEYASLKISWTKIENMTYNFSLSTTMSSFVISTDSDNFYDATDLDPDENYRWSVQSENSAGDTSAWSPEWTFKTKLPASVINGYINDSRIEALPNPAEGSVNIKFTLESDDKPILKVYSLEGNLIKMQILGNLPAGENNLNISLENIQAGSYFVVIEGKKYNLIRSIIVL